MTRARCTLRFNEHLPCGANNLKPMMFNDYGFPGGESNHQRRKSGPANVNDIRGAHQLPQLPESWPPDDQKRKVTVVKICARRLRDERNPKFRRSVSRTELGESSREGHHDRLYAADTGCKI